MEKQMDLTVGRRFRVRGRRASLVAPRLIRFLPHQVSLLNLKLRQFSDATGGRTTPCRPGGARPGVDGADVAGAPRPTPPVRPPPR